MNMTEVKNEKDRYSELVAVEVESSDFLSNEILQELPDLLTCLLVDRTTTTKKKVHNIIWATDNYSEKGKGFGLEDELSVDRVTGDNANLVLPRALKDAKLQKERTKGKAEVFTPTWIVKKQNDAVDENYVDDDLETYINRTWLEITCGEAPYMATRYDMYTGEILPLEERVGFVDRKLSRISAEVNNKEDWANFAKSAYKASYGFEWSGDSLYLARQNLLLTFIDYYIAKFHETPDYDLLVEIIEIITYNIFQMDGLKYIIPLTEKIEEVPDGGIVFPGMEPIMKTVKKDGKRVKIMNWTKGKMEFFMPKN